MRKNLKSFVIIVLSALFVLFMGSVLVLVCVMLNISRKSNENQILENRNSQMSVYPRSKHSSVNFVKSRKKNRFSDDLLSFSSGKEGNRLISDIHSQQSIFYCRGSCWCEHYDESERRITTSSSLHVMKKSLYFFVASVSSYIAYKQGKEYFEEDCERELSDSCSFVRSSVDDCESTSTESTSDENAEIIDDVPNEITYYCFGKCVDIAPPEMPGMPPEFAEAMKRMEEEVRSMQAHAFQCDTIDHTDKVIVKRDSTETRTYVDGMKDANLVENEQDAFIELARHHFMMYKLDGYCTKHSRFSQLDARDAPANVPGGKIEAGFCSGYKMFAGGGLPENPSVRCVEEKESGVIPDLDFE